MAWNFRISYLRVRWLNYDLQKQEPKIIRNINRARIKRTNGQLSQLIRLAKSLILNEVIYWYNWLDLEVLPRVHT